MKETAEQMSCTPPPDNQARAGDKKTSNFPLTPLKFTLMFSLPFILVFVLLLTIFIMWERNNRERSLIIEMRETARAYFEQIVLTRQWNTEHGSVYVEVTEKVQPNPYLQDDPRRDITMRDGRTFTKINPDFMTRQISELAQTRGNYTFRATGLRPANPQNRPDAWEKEQLSSFEGDKNRIESYEALNNGQERIFRYMAPLILDEGCLVCHGKQGYSVGDVGGGISIEIPMDVQRQSLLAMTRRMIGSLSIIGITALFFIIGITWIFSKKIAQGISHEMERERLNTTIEQAREAAHEIIQPLSVINSYAEKLKIRPADQESRRESIDIIFQESWKIDDIIKKMSNIAKAQIMNANDK